MLRSVYNLSEQLFEVPENIFHVGVVPIRHEISVVSSNFKNLVFFCSIWVGFVKDSEFGCILVISSVDILQVKVYARCRLKFASNWYETNLKKVIQNLREGLSKPNF